MKRHYIVETHVGVFETWATSERKAIMNVRWRVFGGRVGPTWSWKAREVA